MPSTAVTSARRYVAWLRRHSLAVLLGSALILGLSGYAIAFHLPLRADFSYLLPPDAPAVRDLRRLEARVSAQDTILVVVRSGDPGERAAAAADLSKALRALPTTLVARVEDDDAIARSFLRSHRHLFVGLDDLEAARDALQHQIEQAKLKANPLYIDLDDDAGPDPEAAATEKRLADLRAKRKEAEAKLDKSSYVSADGTGQLIVVRTAFLKTEVAAGARLLAEMGKARAGVLSIHPGVEIGFAGGVPTTVAEHSALVRGMVLSSAVTAVLVGLVLLAYFRSSRLLILLVIALLVGTAAAFGAAALTVGHLNAATAFLGAIIAGNGVNYGILLIARFLEERRTGGADQAMAAAIAGTTRPTLVASLGASIAYGSLAVTSFRGFADFAWIGAIGMLLCWVATYTLLPAMVLRFRPDPTLYSGPPMIGTVLAKLFGFQRPGVVCAVAAALALLGGWISYRYIAADPFEYDIKELRSEGTDAVTARRWGGISDGYFGRGISGQTFIAADRLDQVPEIVAALRAADAGKQPADRTIGTVQSYLDVIPDHQPEKLAVLSEIRTMLDDDALAALDDKQRAELTELRPPDDLAPITFASLPEEIATKMRERDGRIGYLIGVRPALTLDEWDGRALIRFADTVRSLQLSDGETVTTSGASVVFADIVTAIESDGPLVTTVAAIGLILMVLLVVGRNQAAVAVMVATGAGSLALVTVCALIGLKVNFLDFVALPITLGLGVDYAINIGHRQHGDAGDAMAALRTSGSAVFVCSLTTIIGYGSLLVSDNLAIRSFGVASLIGEVCCLMSALLLVPAILGLRRIAPVP